MAALRQMPIILEILEITGYSSIITQKPIDNENDLEWKIGHV